MLASLYNSYIVGRKKKSTRKYEMINLKNFWRSPTPKARQGGSFTRLPNTINFKETKEIGQESSKDVQEYSGNFEIAIINNELKLYIKRLHEGGEEDVTFPQKGNTFHTHPKKCDDLSDCSIIPPSAMDMSLFAERHDDQHMVVSLKRVYWVKANRMYDKVCCGLILKFYEIIENHFESSTYEHDRYDHLYMLASKFGNFFLMYKFKNISTLNLTEKKKDK